MNRHQRRAEKVTSDYPIANREIVAFKHIMRAEMKFEAGGSFQMHLGGPGQDGQPFVLVLSDDQVEGIVHAYQTAMAQYKARMATAGQAAQTNN